jgi:S1-C subfamily serine protease
MKAMLALAAAVLLVPMSARAERAKSPADATVFIRLVGSLHADVEENGVKRTIDLDRVEIGTGSGFVISPFGYVITNHHVVSSGEPFVLVRGAQHAQVTVKVSRIDVCFPPGTSTAYGLPSPCAEASVAASDPALDLAVLFFSASNLPYIALGDSDAVSAGRPVDALGYPFGRDVEVGRLGSATDLVPEISTTPGVVSALRAGDAGEQRYLQISNSVNPGNSGGPLVDRDGFVLGVIRMRLTRATGIGFAVPVNQLKDFLESHSLDHLLPVRRLRLGPFQSLEAKAIGLRLPEGMADVSAARSRVETDARSDIALRIDRVYSPWSPKQLEQALVDTQTFERVSIASQESQRATRTGVQALAGHAIGTAVNGTQEIRLDYTVLDLSSEKIVARYVGPPEQIAFNEGVLRESLTSLEGRRFIGTDTIPVDKLEWSKAPTANGQGSLAVPSGWVVEPGGPAPCAGLPLPTAATSLFPARDFTIALRAGVWSNGDIVPDAAALACSSTRSSLGAASYGSRGEWLGVRYFIEGVFVRVGRQIMQLEVVSPDQMRTFAHEVLAAWIKKTTE